MKMLNWRTVLHQLNDLPNTVGRPLSRAYVPELDGLRFVALIFVLIWHASIRAARHYAAATGHAGDAGYYWVLPHGEIGVVVFFFISGYVVSQPFLNRPAGDWNVKSFYIRRFLRIYPPYLLALSLCFIALQLPGHVADSAVSYKYSGIPLKWSYLASVFYAHSLIFNSASRLDPPIWSLELEIAFYVSAPLLLFFYTMIKSRPVRMLALGAIILALVAETSIIASTVTLDGRFRWGLLCHGYLFLLGILAADMAGDALSRPRKTGTSGDGLFLLGLAGIVAAGLYMTQFDARLSGGWTTLGLLLSTVLSLALLFVGTCYGNISSRFLRLPWIRLTGTMCYSVYLTHIVAMQACGDLLFRFVRISEPILVWGLYFAFLIPVSLVVGLIFYLGVERPFAAIAASFGRGKRYAESPAAAQSVANP
jgi:peptidoglycan/LPS O-acetylase OafA/YrhL